MLSVDHYSYLPWKAKFPDAKVSLELKVHTSWNKMFFDLTEDKRFGQIEKFLSDRIKEGKAMYPYPDLVFSAFRHTSYDDVKVVIIGQDPYFNAEKGLPQAMGLSFSVPVGISVPSSLDNIFKNMVKYGHLSNEPDHGNLEFWADQGCLMLNTALTVNHGEKFTHAAIWKWFTDSIISRLSAEKDHLVFVLWGGPALDKLKLIDVDKHAIIVSSHPSGLSVNKPLREYPPFEDNDHFTKINQMLKQFGKREIVFGL